MKRMFSTLLIVCTFAQPVVPVLAQQSAAITITSMDRGSVRPFDRLVITGTGFLPATSAISVLFVPKQHGLPIVVPVFSATATQVEVIVPAFLDPAAGDFGFGQADVQVVQVTSTQVMSSNVLSALDVAPVPTLPDAVGAGRVTRAFMRLSAEFLAGTSGAVFDTFKNEQNAMLAQVDAVVANPRAIAAARTIDASAFVVDALTLKASDRVIAAYLSSVAPLISRQRLGERAHALASETCVVETGLASLDQVICDARFAAVTSSRNWIAGIALVAGGLAVFVALTATGPLMMGLGAAAGAGLFLTSAAQLAYLSVAPTVVPSSLTMEGPSTIETVRDHGLPIFQNASDTAAAAITTDATAGAAAVAAVAMRPGATAGPSPKGGSIVALSRLNQADATREMVAFQGAGAAVVATRIGVPAAQSTRTLAEARLLPLAGTVFDGAYSGSMSWSRTDGTDTWGGVEPVSFRVAGGSVTVTAPYAGSGSINAAGRVVGVSGITPAGFTCTFGGVLEAKTAAGVSAGGGSLGCVPKDGAFTSGAWTASRPATP